MDLSHPAGGSVNNGINGDNFSLSYSWVDDVIDFIILEGCRTLLAKVDIHDAYCLEPVHALPFGLRSAPFIFNQFAEGWHWTLQHNHGVHFLLHYLDNFQLLVPPTPVSVTRTSALSNQSPPA